MKLKLEAFSPTEGIGIVRTGQTLRLVRPPYASLNAPILAEESIQDAIMRHGFFASQEQFENWNDAIAFLNQQVLAARRSLGADIPNSIPGIDILDIAPGEILIGFLDRIEMELIPRRSFDHVEDFLLAFLSSSARTCDPNIGARAVELLRRNKEARKCFDAGISGLVLRGVRFPSLESNPQDLQLSRILTEVIKERGCIFAPTS